MFSEQDKKILQVVMVAAVIAVVGLFYYVWAVVKHEARRLDTDIVTHDKDIKARQKELGELKQWEGREAEINKLVAELEDKIKRLPKDADAIDFYRILTECIKMTNLSQTRISPLVKVPRGAYTEVPYQIQCRARYHDLGQFLMLIEQHKDQIMRIKTLDIGNDMKRPSRHPVTVRVATFVFNRPVPKREDVEATQ